MSEKLDFLDSCVDFLNSLKNPEVEKLRQTYNEEMTKMCEEREFEILLPEELCSTYTVILTHLRIAAQKGGVMGNILHNEDKVLEMVNQ